MQAEPQPRERPPLVLASASPRRLALLANAGLAPGEVLAAHVDESPRPRERPVDLALRLARGKARTVAERRPAAFVIGADTVVACGRRLLGKPADAAEAGRFLRLLSGRRHRVLTGVAVIAPGGAARERAVVTQVAFKRLAPDEIDWYLACGEWQGKAGGYAVQGLAQRFVRWLSGSHSNVVGLPVFETLALLEGLGYPLRAAAGEQGR
jgi:nucleoside triphosphate pyrophosphatase